ncbi:hypothetical protein BDW59DRAFT_178491 [Aspergillus cavernicola]|uniref:NmrA-like domain-containing protein n=1 Tax=Aspergillus cavernicola TaxID=176166 RepID=A0ABR4HBP3_9EURO
MSKIITIVGATGTQGGSVIKALLATPNPPYTIRAITRNPQSDAAKALVEKGIKVVEADLHNVESLTSAFAGTHAIFAVTDFFENLPTLGVVKAMETETELGINLANAAANTDSLEHYVWSTLPNSKQNSSGKGVVPYYESKNAVDSYIKSITHLLRKTTFVWFGWYAGNMMLPLFHPTKIHTVDGSKSYVTFLSVAPSTKIPLLGDERANVGLFVKAILERPEKTLPGRFVAGVMEQRALGDVVSAFAAAKQIQARCVRISREDYKKLWPVWGGLMDLSHYYFEVVGGKAFTSVEGVLTGDDLEVKGLVGVDEAFASLPLLQ